jgi:hypothetical protein
LNIQLKYPENYFQNTTAQKLLTVSVYQAADALLDKAGTNLRTFWA